MEGIAEAGEADDARPAFPGLVGDQAGHASAHRLAADHQGPRLQRGDGPLPGLQQHRLAVRRRPSALARSEEHTSELQSLMRISYAVFCLKKKTITENHKDITPR